MFSAELFVEMLPASLLTLEVFYQIIELFHFRPWVKDSTVIYSSEIIWECFLNYSGKKLGRKWFDYINSYAVPLVVGFNKTNHPPKLTMNNKPEKEDYKRIIIK